MSHLLLPPADMEGAYRFIRSPYISAEAIANAGFAVTATHARDHSLLLAQEDTTALTFNHASVVSVCDREADIYEYLRYKQQHRQRFVVRSMQSRCINEHDNKRYDDARQCQSAGTLVVKIPQRGGRKAREIVLDIKFARVTLKAPANTHSEPDISLYYVGCIEQSNADDRLEWHLLTSEAVISAGQACHGAVHWPDRPGCGQSPRDHTGHDIEQVVHHLALWAVLLSSTNQEILFTSSINHSWNADRRVVYVFFRLKTM